MKNNINSVSKAVKLALFATAASSVMLSSNVSAQAADAKVEDVEKIAVVGSRAAPRSVAESPVPIDIIGGEELAKAGNTDMLEILKGAVPSLNVHSNPISDAATLVRPANLRGIPSDSTLELSISNRNRCFTIVFLFIVTGVNSVIFKFLIIVIDSILEIFSL